MKAIAAIVLKSFHELKPKLAAVLNVGEQRALTKAMFEDVANAAQACEDLAEVAVISPEQEVLERARERGMEALHEEAPVDMDAAFREGVRHCQERGGEVLLCLPADLPLLTPRDVAYLLGRVRNAPQVIVVPSTIGPGTSILLLTPPDAIAPQFEEDDHLVHLEEAMKADVPAEAVELLQGGLDVDTPKDLARLFLVERPCKTRDLLEDMEVLDRFRPYF